MKTTVFRHEAAALKALAHYKRLEIVQLLARRELTASEIQHMTGFPQANLSQHLSVLKAAQILVAVRTGKNLHFRLSHPNFAKIGTLLAESQTVRPPQKNDVSHTRVQDPVCGMYIEPAATHWQQLYKGATYFFCASGCERRFAKAPAAYV